MLGLSFLIPKSLLRMLKRKKNGCVMASYYFQSKEISLLLSQGVRKVSETVRKRRRKPAEKWLFQNIFSSHMSIARNTSEPQSSGDSFQIFI